MIIKAVAGGTAYAAPEREEEKNDEESKSRETKEKRKDEESGKDHKPVRAVLFVNNLPRSNIYSLDNVDKQED